MCWGHTQWLHCFNGLCNHFQRGFPILCQQRRNFGTTSVLHCLIPQTSNPSEETCERFDSFSRAFLPPLSLCLRTHMQHSSCLHACFLFVLVLFYSISCFTSSHLMGIKWITLLVCHLAFVSQKLKGAEMLRLYFVLFYVFFPCFF